MSTKVGLEGTPLLLLPLGLVLLFLAVPLAMISDLEVLKLPALLESDISKLAGFLTWLDSYTILPVTTS